MNQDRTTLASGDAEQKNPSNVKNATRRERTGGRFGVGALALLVGLLAAPAWAIYRLRDHVEWWWPAGAIAGMSLVAYVAYAVDKKRAQENGWRTHESTLHLCELLGGWPGAFVAQRRLRHKTAKLGFQVWFWVIVAAYEYVAAESLMGWAISRRIVDAISGRL